VEMNFEEEQEQEVEALQSIYMDDFLLIEKNKYEITLKNEPEEEIQVQIKLSVEYPETYPEVPCYFSIESLDLTRTGISSSSKLTLLKKVRICLPR
jgi:hypothetical protein